MSARLVNRSASLSSGAAPGKVGLDSWGSEEGTCSASLTMPPPLGRQSSVAAVDI